MVEIHGHSTIRSHNTFRVIIMARYNNRGRTTYGKAFQKKTSRGKHRKGTWIKYKYVNGRKVSTVRSRR